MRTIKGEMDKWATENQVNVHLPKNRKRRKNVKKKNTEELSTREWENLIDKYKDRYYRGPGGAFRSR
ncbi:hypothetical protein [Cytobacillus sp. IB215316]|uniref:hypothetical protein n=1 Tax=Cytobacillus sp. IB215316 TaxID=3097354 RepID=UPI002A12EF0A|nr:hypothetical protein [Cytobacillus sp. IB215316]MDX8359811.1 hypothetical protein [Cytobacillus sp. IB215316]